MRRGWNPLLDGFPKDLEPIEFDRSMGGGGQKPGKVQAFIYHGGMPKARICKKGLVDAGHDFGMVEQVHVERDTSLSFDLTCGCTIVLADAIDGRVIEVRA